jgi:hypothetical protein
LLYFLKFVFVGCHVWVFDFLKSEFKVNKVEKEI